MEYKRISIKGHKLKRSWGGCEDTYAHGRCECGDWHYRGWTDRMWSVVRGHNSHLEKVKRDRIADAFAVGKIDADTFRKECRTAGMLEDTIDYLITKLRGHDNDQHI